MKMSGKRNKYGAVRTAGFASKAEAARFIALKLMESGGVIKDLECQPKFAVSPDGCAPIRYTPDFVYRRSSDGALVAEDVKGVESRDFRLRAKLFRWKHPRYRLMVVKRKGRGWSEEEFR